MRPLEVVTYEPLDDVAGQRRPDRFWNLVGVVTGALRRVGVGLAEPAIDPVQDRYRVRGDRPVAPYAAAMRRELPRAGSR